MSLTTFLKGTSDSTTEVRNQVELNGQPFKTFKFGVESLPVIHQATILEQKNIGSDILIWGNENFGIWGSFKWGSDASQSFILGLSKLGVNALGDRSSSFEVVRVIPPQNVFRESFVSDYFINTSETTATLGTNIVTFTATSEVLVSKEIYLETTRVADAKMTITTTSDISNFGLYMNVTTSESTWESVTSSITHTFISSGQRLRYKLIPIQPNKNISNIRVEINKL